MEIAQSRAVSHAGVNHETEILRSQLHSLSLAIMIQVESGNRDIVSLCKIYILYRTILLKYHALFSQELFYRADHAVVLVQRASRDAFQCLNSAEFKNHSVHIPAEFKYAAPGLECECGLPHMPEIRCKEMRHVLKPLLDRHIIQFLLIGTQKLQDSHSLSLGKAHAADIQNIAVPVDQTCFGAGGMRMVEIQNFLCYASVRLC